MKKIVMGDLIHADETKIRLKTDGGMCGFLQIKKKFIIYINLLEKLPFYTNCLKDLMEF